MTRILKLIFCVGALMAGVNVLLVNAQVITDAAPVVVWEPSVTTITVLVAGIVTVIGSIVTGVVTIIGALKRNTDAVVKSSELTGNKLDEVGETTKTTLGHVNSAMTKAQEEIAGLRRELELSRQTSSQQKETAALLAQAKATADVRPLAPSNSATDSLQKIDTNTAAIEKNTAKTEETVKELKDKTS